MRRLRLPFRSFTSHPIWGAVAVVCVIMTGFVAFFPHTAHAATDVLQNAIIQVLGGILSFFVYVLGSILVKFIDILIAVFQFDNFIDATAVKVGWSVTRDVANMFFIVALLVMAIGTVFRIEEYRYSRLLQRFLIMAILINFSKSIAGFFIDLSQVVMLTFVNAFKDMAAGNLTAGFGIQNMVALSKNVSASSGEINFFSVVGAMFAAVVMLFIATVVVAIFAILLIQRIIMLWIYIVLAPTAYMVAVLPGSLGSWWGSWWRDFSQYLIKGPVIAFFMWLALTVISLTTTPTIISISTKVQDTGGTIGGPGLTGNNLPAMASEATTSEAIINYIVAIGMLIAGLQQAVKAGGAAGSVAGKWMGNFNRWGGAIATSPLKAGGAILKRPAYGVAGGALGGAAAAFNSKGLAWTGLGTTFGKMNARLNKKRLRSEEKDSDWVNYADPKTVAKLATGSFALTEAGRRDQKIARERMLKNNEVKNLKEDDREHVLNAYQKDIGRRFDSKNNRETFVDVAGGKLLNDAIERDPTILTAGWNHLDSTEQNFRTDKMQRIMSRMSPTEMAKMNPNAWKNQAFTDAVLKDPDEKFIKRFEKDKFRDAVSTNVGSDVKDDMRDAIALYGGRGDIPSWSVAVPNATGGGTHIKGDDYIRFQQDIDRDRQQRTAERVAAYQQRNLNFHESDEYLKNQGQFYDASSFAANTSQEERRSRRENDRARGAFMPVSGASAFAKGSDNALGVSAEELNEAGVKLTTAGTVTNPEEKKRLAEVVSKKLAADIADVESQLATTAPDILDSIPSGSGTGTTTRQAMEQKLKNLSGVQSRLDDTSQLGSIQFVNADRFGGSFRNAKAEENFHDALQQMDPDGSFREQLRQSLSPAELQKIIADQRAIPGQEGIDEKGAFEEHLAKGLVNLTRENWADTGPNATKLSSGLALQIQRQAEAKGVKMHNLTLLQQQANVQVPSRFATVGAGTRAVARGVTEKASNVASSAYKKVSGVASKVTSGAGGVISKVSSATAGAAVGTVKKASEVATAPIRAAQRYSGQQAAQKAEKKRAEVPTDQLNVRVTKEMLQEKRQELAAFEKQTQLESNALNQEYSTQKQIMSTAKNRLVAKTAAEKMDSIQKTLKGKVKALKEKRDGVADYELMLRNSQESLGANVGGAYRASEKAAPQTAAGQGKPKPAAPQGTPQPVTPSAAPEPQPAPTPKPTTPTTPPKTAPAAAAPTTAPSTAASTTVEAPQSVEPQTTVNNTTVIQNITNAFKAAPPEVRGKLMAIDSKTLDSALHNSIVWKGLMSYIKNNTAEIQKSEQLGDIGRDELQKRIGKLQNHMDEGNAEAFKSEFGELQSMFGGGGTESTPEA